MSDFSTHNGSSVSNTYGSVLAYRCFFGYYFGRATDVMYAECTATGDWDSEPRHCERTCTLKTSLVHSIRERCVAVMFIFK